MWLLVSTLTMAGPRCGPNRCADDELCGNDSCGMCAPPGGAVILPDCGWAPGQVGGRIPLVPQVALRPFLQSDLDVRLDAGRAGDAALARFRALFQTPLAGSTAASVVVDFGGASPPATSFRQERVEVGVLWSPPFGTPRVQGAVHLGVLVDRTVSVSSDRWLGPLGRATDSAPFVPRPWIGFSYVGVPRPFWLGTWGLSVQLDAGLEGGGVDPGTLVTGHVSYQLWGQNPLGASLALTWRDQTGFPQVEAPLGIYVLPQRMLHLGVEAGPAAVWVDGELAWGVVAALRVRGMVTRGQVQEIRREVFGVR